MRDDTYFNDKFYLFGNKELKEELKKHCDEKGTKLYLVIDEALRDYLSKQGKEFLLKPKVPKLV